MRAKTPREKKQISDAREGRNVSGEIGKPSREKIPLAKGAHPAIRKLTRQEPPASTPPLHGPDAAPPRAPSRASSPEGWKKRPDVRLGEPLERRKIRPKRP